MTLRFGSVIATDKVVLPALLYTPEQSTSKAAIWLHGMGDNGSFYAPTRMNALGEKLTQQGIAFLALNNRGAHNQKRLKLADETLPEEDRSYLGGTHYEKIADCVHDIDGAVNFLKEQGFSEFYLIGHSSGANKICVYDSKTPKNPFTKYVFAGPGDDSGLFRAELGDKKFRQALTLAEQAVASHKPFKIMPQYTGMYPFSAQSALDILHPDGDYNTFPFFEATQQRMGTKPLFKEYGDITLPTLVIFGEHDEYTYTAGGTEAALALFKQYRNPDAQTTAAYATVPQTDHSFHGSEMQFAASVAEWLSNG